MYLGQPIVTIDCTSNAEGITEHAALITRVLSDTEVNCVVFVDGPLFNPVQVTNLQHESVAASGPRFRLPA